MPPPDRWEEYSPLGDIIPGTRLVCCKVPLKQVLCREMKEDARFTPVNLKTMVEDKGFNLKLVIDLTFTTKYYGSHEFKNQGIQYEKIFTEGHIVPSDDVVYRMFDVLEKFYEENPNEDVIACVHCTHGVNRTGYLVCRYMIERLAIEPEEAIKLCGEARGHPIERENYLADLKTRKLNTEYKYEGREKLPMVKKEFGRTNQGTSKISNAHQRDRRRLNGDNADQRKNNHKIGQYAYDDQQDKESDYSFNFREKNWNQNAVSRYSNGYNGHERDYPSIYNTYHERYPNGYHSYSEYSTPHYNSSQQYHRRGPYDRYRNDGYSHRYRDRYQQNFHRTDYRRRCRSDPYRTANHDHYNSSDTYYDTNYRHKRSSYRS